MVVESWHRSYCNGWELDKYSQASLLLTVKPFIASHLNSFILTPTLAFQRNIQAQTQTTRYLQSNIKFIPWFVLWMKQSWGNDSHKKIWQFQMFHLENVPKIETSRRHYVLLDFTYSPEAPVAWVEICTTRKDFWSCNWAAAIWLTSNLQIAKNIFLFFFFDVDCTAENSFYNYFLCLTI